MRILRTYLCEFTHMSSLTEYTLLCHTIFFTFSYECTY
ncbi:unnamed protein product [Chironomus riparius]|uniref:Uncharacterized protein n=1 Tax=Chironomus riparius TaxID=315576 RepID=A0A9N9RJ37_9DIPT|nr:unnamed protein product [Chironomus riparius]